MQKSKIEWTGWTWNPITGCTKGCGYCYARKMAENPYYKRAFPFGFEPHFYPERLKEISKTKPGDKVFVCSMGELFADHTDATMWTRLVLDAIRSRPDVVFQLLTKRPENLKPWSPFPKNCWVGVSLTGKELNGFAYRLTQIEAKVKFLSIEPLLAPLVQNTDSFANSLQNAGINWLIIGQQTPVKVATTPKIEWIREIVEAADKVGIPVFLKNNLNSCEISDYPELLDSKGNLRQEFPK